MDRTQGIILKKIPIGEFDELLVCYTKDFGKLKIMAKGIHQKASKQRNHLDILTLADFLIVKGRHTDTVRSALSLNKFSNIKADLKLSALVFSAVELVNKTIFENQPDLNIWNLLLDYLNHLNEIDPNPYTLDPSYILSLFHSFFSNLIKFHGRENGFKPFGKISVNSYLNNINGFFYADFGEKLNSLQFLKKVL